MKNYSYTFYTNKPSPEVFELLLHINEWWSGIYDEIIKGESKHLNDEFTFKSGSGAHYSKHRLIKLTTDKKIEWQVMESNLSFLNSPTEWENTNICFDIETENNKTKVTFTHKGLVPEVECYDSCSNSWTQYLTNLEQKLN